jgi:hypothetical protein
MVQLVGAGKVGLNVGIPPAVWQWLCSTSLAL